MEAVTIPFSRGTRTMAEEGEAHVLVAERVEELEVAVEDGRVFFEDDGRLLVVGPLRGDRMARRVDGLDRVLRLESEVDSEFLQRVLESHPSAIRR